MGNFFSFLFFKKNLQYLELSGIKNLFFTEN
jgi:hypothetical protein